MTTLNEAMDPGRQAAARIQELEAENTHLRRERDDAIAAVSKAPALHTVISEIRQIKGVGYRPMITDLPTVLRGLIENANEPAAPQGSQPATRTQDTHYLVKLPNGMISASTFAHEEHQNTSLFRAQDALRRIIELSAGPIRRIAEEGLEE